MADQKGSTRVPLLADLLLNRQSGIGGRFGFVALFSCRFGRRLEEITGDVVDHALLPDVPPFGCASVHCHALPLGQTRPYPIGG